MPQNNLIPIFDGHNDVLLRYASEEGYDFFTRSDQGHLDFPRAREGGFAGGIFAMFTSNPRDPDAPPFDPGQYITENGYAFPYAEPITHELALTTVMPPMCWRIIP